MTEKAATHYDEGSFAHCLAGFKPSIDYPWKYQLPDALPTAVRSIFFEKSFKYQLSDMFHTILSLSFKYQLAYVYIWGYFNHDFYYQISKGPSCNQCDHTIVRWPFKAQKTRKRMNRAQISTLTRYIISSVFLTWNLRCCPPMFAASALYAIPGFEQLKTRLRVRVYAVLRCFT
jgi:hypothetical protein